MRRNRAGRKLCLPAEREDEDASQRRLLTTKLCLVLLVSLSRKCLKCWRASLDQLCRALSCERRTPSAHVDAARACFADGTSALNAVVGLLARTSLGSSFSDQVGRGNGGQQFGFSLVEGGGRGAEKLGRKAMLAVSPRTSIRAQCGSAYHSCVGPKLGENAR
jgi:hypothetical protein